MKLTISHCYSLKDEIVQSIIAGQEECDTLVFQIICQLVDESFWTDEKYNKFWKKLAMTVSTFTIHFVDNSLTINDMIEESDKQEHVKIVLNFILTKFFVNNVGPETVILDCLALTCDVNKWNPKRIIVFGRVMISFPFIQVLSCCKFLKKLIFNCNIPLEVNTISDIFATINYQFLNMDNLSFDCDPLPSYLDYQSCKWVIEKIEMEFIVTEEVRSVIIKPLQILSSKYQNCNPSCSIHHSVFKSQSVREFWQVDGRKCREYYRSCVESFPKITDFIFGQHTNRVIFEMILTKLSRLEYCKFSYLGPCLKKSNFQGLYPNMKNINADFELVTPKSIRKFIKSYPNLTQLTMEVKAGITDDVCIKIITENLKNLEYLTIKCRESKLTPNGLQLIENFLKKLKGIHINCDEEDYKQFLFNKLPNLQKIISGDGRKSERSEEVSVVVPVQNIFIPPENMWNAKQINDLPNEILAKIIFCMESMPSMH